MENVEKALLVGEDFKKLLEISPDAIVLIDETGNIVSVNTKTEELFGYSKTELINKKSELLIPPRFFNRDTYFKRVISSPPNSQIVKETTKERDETDQKTDQRSNLYALRKDGTEFPIEISLNSMQLKERIIICAFIKDISERKRIEKEIFEKKRSIERKRMLLERDELLEEKNVQLELSNKELELFSYSMSHYLHSPIRHISLFAKSLNSRLLENDTTNKLDVENLNYLNNIIHESNQMSEIIDGLLAYIRLGHRTVNKISVNLNDLIAEVVEIKKSIHFDTTIKWVIMENFPDVNADAGLLKDVLIILLANAIKFSRIKTPIKIEIGHFMSGDELNAVREVVVYVKDNGIGFDMRYYNKLFNLFQKLHVDRQFEGIGIGLANLKRIIEKHGGRVWGEGKVGEGATFYFSLPK